MDAGSVDGGVVAWCRRRLGAEPAEVLFRAGYLSQVTGLRLADGRAVVLGALAATAEELVPTGHELAPGPDAAGRFAALLAELVRLVPDPGALPSLAPSPPWAAWDHDRPGLWPPPDDRPGDLNDHPGPPWLDRTAAAVRARLAGLRLPPVVGHADWESQNLRWDGDRPLAVHDCARALGAGRPPRLTAQSPRAGQGTKVSEPAKAGRASRLTARWPWPGRHMARALPNRSATAARTRRPPAGGDVSRRGPSVLLGPVHLRVGGGSGGGVA